MPAFLPRTAPDVPELLFATEGRFIALLQPSYDQHIENGFTRHDNGVRITATFDPADHQPSSLSLIVVRSEIDVKERQQEVQAWLGLPPGNEIEINGRKFTIETTHSSVNLHRHP